MRTDTFRFTFLNDPTDISGRRDRNLTNARDRSLRQGGNTYAANYSRIQGGVLLEGAFSVHNGEVSDFSAVRAPANTVIFRAADTRTLADEQLGGFGQDLIDERDTKGARGTALWTVGRHAIKGGLEWSRNSNFRNTGTLSDAVNWSFANSLSGLT